jgi:putative inorganic carbon (hco3(-)) transporter
MSTTIANHQQRLGPNSAFSRLEGLELRALWKGLRSQSTAMWLVQLYVFFEYVRPQSIYEWLDVLPWSQLSLIGAVVACAVEGRYRFTASKLWVSFGVLTLVVLTSSLVAYSPAASWESRNIWINWTLLMLIVGAGIKSRQEFLLLILAFGLWNLKMTQHGVRGWAGIGFGFRDIGIGGAPGWFHNSGEFGIQMCVFLPIAGYYAYGVWPAIGSKAKLFLQVVILSAVMSMIATSSRGALVGGAATALWVIWRSPHRVRTLIGVGVVGASVWLFIPSESKERFRQIGEDQSSTNRITYWKHGIEIANSHPVLGVGYKNWFPYYTTFYNPKGQVPHNFLIEAVAELGYIGMLTVLWMIAASFYTTSQVRRRTSANGRSPDRLMHSLSYGLDGALIGFIVSGSFVSVLYYPYLWMNTAMVMALARVTAQGTKPMERPVRSLPIRTKPVFQ